MIMLSELVIEYHKNQVQIKTLEENKKRLKALIDLNLSSINESKYEDSHYSAILASSKRVKYDHERLMEHLMNLGFTQVELCTPKLDLKKLEKLVVAGDLDPVLIAEFTEVKNIKTLTVKEK